MWIGRCCLILSRGGVICGWRVNVWWRCVRDSNEGICQIVGRREEAEKDSGKSNGESELPGRLKSMTKK